MDRLDPDTDGISDWAHAPLPGGAAGSPPHLLNDHLRAVGLLAERFAAPSAREWARLAGLWHDLGKRRVGFQRFIRAVGGVDAHIEGRVPDRDKTHSAAGALWAEQWLAQAFGPKGHLLSRLLQYVIAGHHAGLDDWDNGGLEARLARTETQQEFTEALARFTPDDILQPAGLLIDGKGIPLADDRQSPGRMALWVRMLFSALVDADFLDTEAYFNPGRARDRLATLTAADLKPAFDAHMQGMTAASAREADTLVNRARAGILSQCRAKAALPPGVFSLTVPTGGGKTLSSLAFALDHAARHGKQRVVYAIPYTSIIEQTADVFRRALAAMGEDVVVEHHSNAEPERPEQETARSRLACENWDAPLVVTTNVQLFESLFARKTSRCRKLHNLRDSVIVLDEAQLLPVEFLQPIVDVLRCLVQDFGVTLLLCTATQPGLTARPGADATRGLRRGIAAAGCGVTEVIDDVPSLYNALQRVRVQLPGDLHAARPWEEVADEVAGHDAVLTIVSRRADAAHLYRLVAARTAKHGPAGADGCWHLSALMCAQHRSDTIASIKTALQTRRETLAKGCEALPVRVVSTQLVEAGVDLDFPVVYRALAGLDSIAQAAGRCNREGRLPGFGEVHVFVPPTEPPPGLLRLARDRCRLVWHDRPADPFSLDLISRYFAGLYADAPSTDAKGISELLKLDVDRTACTLSIGFRSAAEAFKLIDDKDGATVLVRYRSPNAREDIDALIGLLARDGPSRWLMRKLQRYSVTVYRHQIGMLVSRGDVRELPSCPGLYVQTEGWDGFYDPVLGARVDSAPGDPAAYVA